MKHDPEMHINQNGTKGIIQYPPSPTSVRQGTMKSEISQSVDLILSNTHLRYLSFFGKHSIKPAERLILSRVLAISNPTDIISQITCD